jgi:predicted patatin/cPLA2 family phospholipase
MFETLKGSCALPLLYRRPVLVGGERVVDGGVSDPVPVEEAYRRGAREILVIRSRPAEFVKTRDWSVLLTAALLRGQRALARAIQETADKYQRAVAFARTPPTDCRVHTIAPAAPLLSGRTTQARRKLEQDYALGRQLARDAIARWPA